MQTHRITVIITDKDAEVLEVFNLFIKSETLNTAAHRVHDHIERKFDTEEP